MKPSDLTSSIAVESAIEEFDKRGRKSFLKKYDFGESDDYFLFFKGRYYDSKAILGAALGKQFPDEGALKFGAFKGGPQTIDRLSKLGFKIVELPGGPGKLISTLAADLNSMAKNYAIGQLQDLRAALHNRQKSGNVIFANKSIYDTYAFHYGGRRELQFNIGLDGDNDEPFFRFGVAFSLEPNITLPEIEPLGPKIDRFNEFLEGHRSYFQDLRMWVWEGRHRHQETAPHKIALADFKPHNFIFIGTHSPIDAIDPNRILQTFDYLLTLYRYTEGDQKADIPSADFKKSEIKVGDTLSNEEIRKTFGVGNMGGMRKNTRHNSLVLISDPFKGLYQDRWEGPILHYTGMGKSGDQSLGYSQNRTLNESSKNGTTVHLLEASSEHQYRYLGRVSLAEKPYQERQLDGKLKLRRVWMFPLKLLEADCAPEFSVSGLNILEARQARVAKRLSLEQLRAAAEASGSRLPGKRSAAVTYYGRKAFVVEFAKRLANGKCDLCRLPAPFEYESGEGYLECHHIVWLSKGGVDLPENAVALCPNCHRKMHILNKEQDRAALRRRVKERERSANKIG